LKKNRKKLKNKICKMLTCESNYLIKTAVFDWANANLHIAQAANCGTNIVAIGSGADSVPGGNGECSFGVKSVVNFGLMVGAALFAGLSAL